MDSPREQILKAVYAALNGADKPTGTIVHRHRTRPVDQDDLPSIVSFFLRERVDRVIRSVPMTEERVLELGVVVRVEGDPTPDEALDPLLTWCNVALLTDQTLGGLAMRIERRSIDTAAEETNIPVGGALIKYEIQYRAPALS